jgi:hypothetical protein
MDPPLLWRHRPWQPPSWIRHTWRRPFKGEWRINALDAARACLARGWSVIPIAARGKRPVARWQDYQARLPEPAEIARWFGEGSEANLGIVTGRVSALVVLDIDPAHGGGDSLSAWEARHGPMAPTVECETGGGGRHLYFRHPGGEVRNRVGLAPGIDLRGDGGLVVAPPSVHPSGRRYRWREGRAPDAAPLAPMPAWLLRLVLRAGAHRGHPLPYWRSLVGEGVAEGRRNDTVASLAGHLLWHGVDAEVALELLLCWNRVKCRPPLADAEVAETVASIARLHAREHGAD